MTRDNHENITRKLDHVLVLVDLCCEQFRHITCSERAALLLALRMASAQVAKNINVVRELLFKYLVDEYRVDYADYARRYSMALQKMKDELAGAPMLDAIDTNYRPMTDPLEIRKHEDTNYNIGESRVNYARVILMGNATRLYEEIEDNLQYIVADLRGIQKDYDQLADHPESLDEKLDYLRQCYEKYYWKDDKEAFAQKVRDYIADHGNKQENYERYQRSMMEDVDELTEVSIAGLSVAQEIFRRRKEITMEAILCHFQFKYSMDLMTLRILSFDMLSPCRRYKDLFVNNASYELCQLLVNTLALYGRIEKNYQYAALKFVLDDLNLTYKSDGYRNGTEFTKFINDTFLRNGEQIKDATTITQYTKLPMGHSFGMEDMSDYLTVKQYEKLYEPYYYCLWIVMSALDVDIEECDFKDEYRDKPKNLPIVEEYKDIEGNYIYSDIQRLQSVLMGDVMKI